MARKSGSIRSDITSRKSRSEPIDDVFLFENGFRGFKKIPTVLLERTDITPFLKNNRFENIRTRNSTINDTQKLHLNKLFLQVSVALERIDLDKLKRALKETSNLNNNINSKTDTKFSTLKSNSETITTDEKQPRKRHERTKAALPRTHHLKLTEGGIIQMETDSNLKEFVAKKNDIPQLPIDLTNEEETNNVTLAKMPNDNSKYFYVLIKKTAYKNSIKNLSINNSIKQLCQFQNDQNNFGTDAKDFVNLPNKAIVDPKSKKTVISKHHCEICGKYLSTKSNLTRHKIDMHAAKKELGCALCGEMFAHGYLLKSHRCPCKKQPLNDPPVTPFKNTTNSLHVMNCDKDMMENVDYEISLPGIELNESDNNEPLVNSVNLTHIVSLPNKCYNLLVHEVPVEF